MQKRGYVLVVSVAVAVVLSVYCGSLLVRSVSELGHSTRSLSLSASIHLAEAAVDHAIANLRSNTDTDIASTPLNQGTYWAEVDPLGSSRHQVTAHGSTAGEQRDIEVGKVHEIYIFTLYMIHFPNIWFINLFSYILIFRFISFHI